MTCLIFPGEAGTGASSYRSSSDFSRHLATLTLSGFPLSLHILLVHQPLPNGPTRAGLPEPIKPMPAWGYDHGHLR